MLGEPGASQLLELARQATVCYVVQDEALDDAKHGATAPLLQLEGLEIGNKSSAASASAKAGGAAEMDLDGSSLAGGVASLGARLQPEAERAIALRLAGMCRDMLAANECVRSACACKPSALTESSSSGSAQHHDAPCSLTGAKDGASSSQALGEQSRGSLENTGVTAGRRQLHIPTPAGTAVPGTWLKDAHARMAEQYCVQRSLLLARVAADLECQALMAS